MTPQEILNSLEILSNAHALTEIVLYIPRGHAHTSKDFVGATAQDLQDFVSAVKALQKPGMFLTNENQS